jgi:hypothetical protein
MGNNEVKKPDKIKGLLVLSYDKWWGGIIKL